ncbi:MAG: hypothetical protein J6T80_03480 [Paludibacteraceae bacterium]|nr:hypothetical protein [Paludibacteraceae bacterium]
MSFCAAVFSPLYAQDYLRLSERNITGTARYIGMGGAMTAIGGDPSAALYNPAGLGLYRRSEVFVTFDVMLDRTRQIGTTDVFKRNVLMIPQASAVFSIPSYTLSDEGVQFNNLMLSYNRVQSYSREMFGVGDHDPSLGALLTTADVNWDIPFCTDLINASNSLYLRETGYVNEYALDWAMNISNRWYVGAGLHVQSYLLSSDATYQETFTAQNTEGRHFSNNNQTTLLFSGASFNFSAGFLCRPLPWLRLGFGIQTPSVGHLVTRTSGSLTAQTDTLATSYAPDCNSQTRSFHMPWHTTTSVGFQIGAYALAAVQYDFTHQSGVNLHSLRAGIEVVPVLGLYINAGYAFESTFDKNPFVVPMDPTFDRQDTYFQRPRWTQYASIAVGYRGTHMMVQAAYQCRWQRLNLHAIENTAPYDMHTETHRIVLTLGWHRYY